MAVNDSGTELHDRRRRVIRTDGRVEPLEQPVSMAQIGKIIGAETLDVVNLRHMGPPAMVMVSNDRQYEVEEVKTLGTLRGRTFEQIELRPTKALLPVNAAATALYHANTRPGTTHQILGDVVIIPDDDCGVLA